MKQRRTGNTVTNEYGAAYYEYSSGWTSISDCVFKINKAQRGGAIYVAGVAYIDGSTFDGNKATNRGGAIYSNADLIIRNSLFSNNQVDGSSYAYGGAIYLDSDQAYIVDTSFQSNEVIGSYAGTGGGIYVDAYVSTVFQRVTLSGNTATKDGGGIFFTYTNENGKRIIEESEISRNNAGNVGGGLRLAGYTTVRNSLIVGNTADYGGGVYSTRDVNLLQNTTVSGNTAQQVGGGLYNSNYASDDDYKIDLKNVTIANNTAPVAKGGNLFNEESRVRLINTIVANAQSGDDCSGEMTSLGYNIDTDNSCNLAETGDQPGTNPTIGDLADNGGRTQTHALLSGSPAIGAVIVEHCEDVDQRFFYRKNGTQCDIGAFEFDSADADSGKLTYKAGDFNVGEGDVTATITVSRVDGNEGTVSVDYFDIGQGTASAASYSDYSFEGDTLVWGDGDNLDKTFEITIRDDNTEEGIETVNLGLKKAFGGASLGTHFTSVLNIIDDDVHYGAMRFSASTYDVREDEGQLAVTVERSGGSYGEVTVDYNTEDAEATAGSDYTAVSGTLQFAFDETSKTITIPIANDGTQEGDETFKLNLDNPTRGATLGFPALSTVTIKGNDNEGGGTSGDGSGGTSVAGDSDTNDGDSGGGGPLHPLTLLLAVTAIAFRKSRNPREIRGA